MLVIVVSLSWSDDGYADETTSRRPSGPTRSDTRNETRSRLNDAKRTSDAKRNSTGRRGRDRVRGWEAAGSERGDPPDVRGGRAWAPGFQAPGGAVPRSAGTSGDKRLLDRRPVAHVEMMTLFAVVIMPPLSTAAAARKGDAHTQTS